MIKPKHNFLISGFFNKYINWIIIRHFKKVDFNPVVIDAGKSVLLVANHFSWWDGFLLYRLNKILFKKTFYAMVLDETMQEVSFMKYLGGFSVNRNSRQVMESLNYASELLNDPGNLVLIFPQGKLYSNFVDEVKFEKGLFKIASLAKGSFQYVFAAAFIEHFEHKKPSVYIGLETYGQHELESAEKLEAAYQQHYRLTKQQQTHIIV